MAQYYDEVDPLLDYRDNYDPLTDEEETLIHEAHLQLEAYLGPSAREVREDIAARALASLVKLRTVELPTTAQEEAEPKKLRTVYVVSKSIAS